ncbi:MAG TPA: hypothetical protein VK914_06850 [bacterium]|jgi:hypothetical protein|nr:hypothetical protein [bacterium]
MSSQREALLFLDMDKGKAPQLDEQRALVRKDEALRAGWFQYQALQALALESAPQPSERMVQAVLAQCRRDHVSRQLSQLTGGDDLAREILLGKVPQSRGPAAWILGLLLLGASGLGWSLYRSGWLGTLFPSMGQPATAPSAAATASSGPLGADAVPFEFPVQTPPVEAALSQPVDDASNPDADDVHGESPASRQARRLLQEHLHEAETREQAPDADSEASNKDSETQASPADTDSNSDAESDEAPGPAAAAPSPKPAVLLADLKLPVQSAPLISPKAVPTPVLAQAAAGQRLSPSAASGAIQPSLTLSSDSLSSANGLTATASGPQGPLDVALGMPGRTDIDVRLFGPDGKSTRTLAAGAFGPGTVHFLLNAADDQGQALAPGTYYLRVMTPWFSRVEPIQIH